MPDFVLAQIISPVDLNGPLDIKSLPVPGSSKKNNYIKGLRRNLGVGSTAGDLEYVCLEPMELTGVELSCSGYEDGDNWSMDINSLVTAIHEHVVDPASDKAGDIKTLYVPEMADYNVKDIYLGNILIPDTLYGKDYANNEINWTLSNGIPIVDEPLFIVFTHIKEKRTICDCIYTKEIGESKEFYPVEILNPGDQIRILFSTQGAQKTVWVDLKFLK